MSNLACYTTDQSDAVIMIIPVSANVLPEFLATQTDYQRNIITMSGFTATSSEVCLVPDETGRLAFVVCAHHSDPLLYANIICKLPAGIYDFQIEDVKQRRYAQIAWGMQTYQFSRYKKATPLKAICYVDAADYPLISTVISGMYLTRDLINTPAEDMLPSHLAEATRLLASQFGATYREVVGDDLLTQNYPAIHTVGRASVDAPRLLELRYGNPAHPAVVLIGKGVCFDSGGLDIKPSEGMRFMKKDMGGAAHVLGLAQMIMQAKLPIQLRVLIPAVENAISSNAFRPGDIITMRNGKSVEVGNTDAEGRLVLADAMVAACEETPELIIDFATLTGAARMAVGGEIAAFFTNDDTLAHDLMALDDAQHDPMWRMPLFAPYRRLLDCKLADLSNVGTVSIGGAIIAALFLEAFLDKSVPWIHFDIMAYNNSARAAHPEGGEAMGLRAMFAYLVQRYGE